MEKEEIAISKFKATCLAVLQRVRKTGQEIVVTRFGQPVAAIVPVRAGKSAGKRRLGTMEGTAVILGDIVGPVMDAKDFDAVRGKWEPERR